MNPLDNGLKNQIIEGMLELWETSDNWTQGVLARDKDNNEVAPEWDSAVSWCFVGCMQRSLHNLYRQRVLSYDSPFDFCEMSDITEQFMNDVARKEKLAISVVYFNDNDNRSFEDVRLLVKQMLEEKIEELYDDDDSEF